MTLRAWAELLRVSALFTVPGDALAGAAASGVRPNRGTALAVGASLCLYEAGMALNDWADREEDAIERPHRPIPSGRITPNAALAAASGLTAAGLLLASRAGRPALALSTAVAATVWAYDLRLKHTPAGPAAMGAARALDVLLGATATRSAAGGTGRTPSPAGRPATARGAASTAPPVTGSPARRGVFARLSAWAGGPVDGQSAGSARRGRPATPVENLASTRAGSAAPRSAATGSGRPSTVEYPGGPTETLASSPATPAGLPPARAARVADPTVSTHRTPPTPQGVLARLSAWAGGSTGRSDGRGRTAAGLEGPAAKAADSVGRFSAPSAQPGVLARLFAGTGEAATGRESTARQGATAGGPSAVPRGALAPAALLGAHTLAVTTVSRREVYGGSVGAPLAALVVTGVLGGVVGRPRTPGATALVAGGLAAAYLVTAGQPYLHAALNPSPQLTQRAVGGGIRAMIPFQAALAARGGSPGIGLAVMGLVPLARKFAKRVSVT